MGSLCSSCCGKGDDNIYESEQNDKTNLLGNPVGESSHSNVLQKHSTDGVGDHQEKLNRILHKTANSYIDVPALNSPVEQSNEKPKDYGSKIQAALKKKHFTEKSLLLQDTPHIERSLSEEPISEHECNLLLEAHTSILEALKSVKVENTENLVIPFNALKDTKSSN